MTESKNCIKCLYCDNDAMLESIHCIPCFPRLLNKATKENRRDAWLLEHYSNVYGIASALYYKYDIHIMPDHNFDSLCFNLRQHKAWRKVSWLDKEQLKAGSGYDLSAMPQELHDWADKYKEEQCKNISVESKS